MSRCTCKINMPRVHVQGSHGALQQVPSLALRLRLMLYTQCLTATPTRLQTFAHLRIHIWEELNLPDLPSNAVSRLWCIGCRLPDRA